jgi:hypothetical protein
MIKHSEWNDLIHHRLGLDQKLKKKMLNKKQIGDILLVG